MVTTRSAYHRIPTADIDIEASSRSSSSPSLPSLGGAAISSFSPLSSKSSISVLPTSSATVSLPSSVSSSTLAYTAFNNSSSSPSRNPNQPAAAALGSSPLKMLPSLQTPLTNGSSPSLAPSALSSELPPLHLGSAVGMNSTIGGGVNGHNDSGAIAVDMSPHDMGQSLTHSTTIDRSVEMYERISKIWIEPSEMGLGHGAVHVPPSPGYGPMSALSGRLHDPYHTATDPYRGIALLGGDENSADDDHDHEGSNLFQLILRAHSPFNPPLLVYRVVCAFFR
jgi:hypothetical protein